MLLDVYLLSWQILCKTYSSKWVNLVTHRLTWLTTGNRWKGDHQLVEPSELWLNGKYQATAVGLVAKCHGVRVMAL